MFAPTDNKSEHSTQAQDINVKRAQDMPWTSIEKYTQPTHNNNRAKSLVYKMIFRPPWEKERERENHLELSKQIYFIT